MAERTSDARNLASRFMGKAFSICGDLIKLTSGDAPCLSFCCRDGLGNKCLVSDSKVIFLSLEGAADNPAGVYFGLSGIPVPGWYPVIAGCQRELVE